MPEPVRNPHPVTWLHTDENRTGTWRAYRPVYVQHTSPCREACPAGEDIARWIDLLRARRYREAWEILTEDNPFPAIMGHICIHSCQSSCNRREHDGSLSINAMEEFLGNRAIAEGWRFPTPPAERAERVAVVGGGPAGLSCAYQLRRLGYQVTLYEAGPSLGGNLRYALPDFQLPVAVVEAEVQRIVDLGMDVRTGVRVGTDISWAEVRGSHAAVVVTTGAPLISAPDLDGAVMDGVVDGLRFLQAVKAGSRPTVDRAVVIGAGLTGVESARTLLRLGARVTLVTAEARQSVPLLKRAEEAETEGVTLIPESPAQAIRKNGPAYAVELPNQVLTADLVVIATGRMTNLEDLPDDAEVDPSFHLDADPLTAATGMPGVFASGDVTGTRYSVEAIGSGKRAAAAIHAYLQGQDPADAMAGARLGYSPNLSMRYYTRPESYPPHLKVELRRVISYQDIEPLYFEKTERHARAWLPVAERAVSFALARRPLSEADVLAESQRCFNCGTCVGCDNCLIFCPDLAINKRADGLGFDIKWDYCKGCGACVNECPREALVLEEEVK